MTDEKLDQILRQALSPEGEQMKQEDLEPDTFGADLIDGHSMERKRNQVMKKRKVIVSAAAVAASAAIVLTGVGSRIGDGLLDTGTRTGNQIAESGSQTPGGGSPDSENAGGSSVKEMDPTNQQTGRASLIPGNGKNAFTMTVQAAERTELEKGKAVPIVQSSIDTGEAWGGDPKTREISYSVDAPLYCEGDNIDKITYSINKGAFQIVSPKNQSYILDGEEYQADQKDASSGKEGTKVKTWEDGKYQGQLNVGNALTGDFDLETGKWEEKNYTSYTIDAKDQDRGDVGVGICGNQIVSKKVYDQLWGEVERAADQEATVGIAGSPSDRIGSEIADAKEAKADAKEKKEALQEAKDRAEKKLENLKKGRDAVFKDIVITCTVTYKDGSTESADLAVGSEIMTLKQAEKSVLVEREDGRMEQFREKLKKYKKVDEGWDARDIYTTFKML